MKVIGDDSVDRRSAAFQVAESWFASRGWHVFDFQRNVWQAYLDGQSGLIHAPQAPAKRWPLGGARCSPGLRTPRRPWRPRRWGRASLRLKACVSCGLRRWRPGRRQRAVPSRPDQELNLPWTVERRTGDISSYAKQRQLKRPPNALITTPESLSLLLSQQNANEYFGRLDAVIVDEWHELLASKRGVQTELCLARLRNWRPGLRTWGLSATLGNLETAMAVLLGVGPDRGPRTGHLVQGLLPKAIVIDSLIPEQVERFPWAGHLGLKMLPQAIAAIEEGSTTLVFTNTRSQTESWFQALLDARPTGRARSPCTTVRSRPQRASLSRTGCVRACCAASSAPPALTWVWTFRRSTVCCRSAAPRASPASCSGRGAAGTNRA